MKLPRKPQTTETTEMIRKMVELRAAVESGAGTDADYAAAGTTVTADADNGFPAHTGDARADQTLVAVEPGGEADQDRRQGH
jgi:hypothetical protein